MIMEILKVLSRKLLRRSLIQYRDVFLVGPNWMQRHLSMLLHSESEAVNERRI